MPDSGSGVGTPVAPGAPTGFDIAEPLKYTLLSLPEYARVMGINPVHFQGAHGGTVWPVKNNRCADVWPRHSWQNADALSREDLAEEIYTAERDVANFLGYWPAPRWVSQEVRAFPRFYRPDVYRAGATDVRGMRVSVRTKWGKVIAPGQRQLSPIGTATTTGGSLTYSDEDGDGFAETASVQLPTTLTDACQIKVYFADTGGAQEWEIRPAKEKTISNGSFGAKFSSWLFINPDLQAAYPDMDDFGAINISTVGNYVSSVDVYREYNDTSQASVTFYWEPDPPYIENIFCSACGGAGCVACALTTQNGCFHIRDAETGVVVPTPATYDEDDTQWNTACFDVCRDPDMVKLYYYSGAYQERWLRGSTCEPLGNDLARAIAWLATARLERPFCSCANVTSLAMNLRQDLAAIGETSHNITLNDLGNPFGTRRGEVMAWRMLSKLTQRRMMGVAV